MKIIFLDIDGVLNTKNNRERLKNINKVDDWDYNNIFDKTSLGNLKDIVMITKANIVLHSSRRGTDALMKPLKIQFMDNGLWRYYIGETPKLSENWSNGTEKEDEIYRYINTNINIEKCVILDDDVSLFKNLEHLVQIDYINGITSKIKYEILSKLQ